MHVPVPVVTVQRELPPQYVKGGVAELPQLIPAVTKRKICSHFLLVLLQPRFCVESQSLTTVGSQVSLRTLGCEQTPLRQASGYLQLGPVVRLQALPSPTEATHFWEPVIPIQNEPGSQVGLPAAV